MHPVIENVPRNHWTYSLSTLIYAEVLRWVTVCQTSYAIYVCNWCFTVRQWQGNTSWKLGEQCGVNVIYKLYTVWQWATSSRFWRVRAGVSQPLSRPPGPGTVRCGRWAVEGGCLPCSARWSRVAGRVCHNSSVILTCASDLKAKSLNWFKSERRGLIFPCLWMK